MSSKRRLPRRGEAVGGEPSLEEVAAERIDAITADPLHSNKYIEIMSPDGTLRLFYNTSTLIRIATDRGMFMQPPHFREPMSSLLRRQVEEIEGRTFHFKKNNVTLHDNAGGGLHVLHRHVFFDQIIDEFYLLNPAELYVCPACYLHWVATRFIPHLTDTRQRIEYTTTDPNPVIDPLDVLAHMQGVNNLSADRASEGDGDSLQTGGTDMERVALTIPSTSELPEWDSPLVHIVFRRAVSWKRHVRRHHNCTRTSAVDYRLKEFISQYISQYNRLMGEKSRKRRHEANDTVLQMPSLTVPRYWHINARYNRLRYNRIVEAVERAEEHIDECTEWMAFRDETVTNTFHSAEKDSSGSDFICDSDSSVGSSYDGFPRYEGPECSDEEEEDEAENSTIDTQGRKRAKTRRKDNDNSSNSSTTTITTTTTSHSSSSSNEEEEVRDDSYRVKQQRLLAPLPKLYRNLSYDERRVLETESRRVFKPTSLYVPPKEDTGCDTVEDDDEESDKYIDWSQIGETIENADSYVRNMQKRLRIDSSTNLLHACSTNPTVPTSDSMTRPNEEETDSGRVTVCVDAQNVQTSQKATPFLHSILYDGVKTPVACTTQLASSSGCQRLLLDDSD